MQVSVRKSCCMCSSFFLIEILQKQPAENKIKNKCRAWLTRENTFVIILKVLV